jgi:hypothetical protein
MLFKKSKTVDSILSSFNTVAADLDTFITTTCSEMADHQEVINVHKDAIEAKVTDVKRANAVLTQINKLIQG